MSADLSLISTLVSAHRLASEFASFFCGDAPWCLEAIEWITGPAAQKSILRGTQVFAYRAADSGRLVGFGSVGTTTWRMPIPDGRPMRLAILPMLAVDQSFHGEPKQFGSCTQRFGGQIVTDLVDRARGLGLPLVVLFVHEDNHKAQSLYRKLGFSDFPERVHPQLIQMGRKL
jgi:ribosomal protein S18 acetylase RimI-like enzyme